MPPAAGDDHARLLHLFDRRCRSHDDIGGLAVREPLAHPADRPEGERDLVAGLAGESRSEIGHDVFHRAGGEDLEMHGVAG